MCSTEQSGGGGLWDLAARQHGVVSVRQLAAFGLSRRAIQHRVARGRLHRVMLGVYAVGRPELTHRGRWMAAVLGCGPAAVLSHASAAALWGIRPHANAIIEISRTTANPRRRPHVRVHRRTVLESDDLAVRDGIPVTAPIRTLIDLACVIGPGPLERAVNEADRLDLVDPSRLREALDHKQGQPGVGRLRALLDRRAFRLTDSELERRFLALVAESGLPPPLTQKHVNGFASTSSGRSSASWSRPTGFDTTARRRSRPET